MPLKPWEVRTIGLGRKTVKAHEEKTPVPAFEPCDDSSYMHAVAEASLAGILGMDFEEFSSGVEAARKLNASALLETPIGEIAVSSLVSKIKSPDLSRKTVVIPKARVEIAEWLKAPHAIVAGFVQSSDMQNGGNLTVSVAGWLWADEAPEKSLSRKPARLRVKIPVYLVPCSSLRPIDTLIHMRVKNG